MADADERRARFKVLIGGAHPQGRLSPETKVALERSVKEMRSIELTHVQKGSARRYLQRSDISGCFERWRSSEEIN